MNKEALLRKAWEFDWLAKDAVGSLRETLMKHANDIRKLIREGK